MVFEMSKWGLRFIIDDLFDCIALILLLLRYDLGFWLEMEVELEIGIWDFFREILIWVILEYWFQMNSAVNLL